MGVAVNLAPQAFGGIVAHVPFVDSLSTILDPSLPLTVTEWEEWGNPLEDPQVYAYMKAYSPYENIGDRTYPPILAITSLNDTRVLYHEPGQVDRPAARHRPRRAVPAQDRDGGGPRRPQRPLRRLARGSLRPRLDRDHRRRRAGRRLSGSAS